MAEAYYLSEEDRNKLRAYIDDQLRPLAELKDPQILSELSQRRLEFER